MPLNPFFPAGLRRHRVTVQNPGTPVPDGDGGYTTPVVVSPVPWQVAIDPATLRDLENVAAGTTTATVSHIVTGPYRDDVDSRSAFVFNGRLLNVVSVRNPGERNISLICVCVEVEEEAPPARVVTAAPAPVPVSAWRDL